MTRDMKDETAVLIIIGPGYYYPFRMAGEDVLIQAQVMKCIYQDATEIHALVRRNMAGVENGQRFTYSKWTWFKS